MPESNFVDYVKIYCRSGKGGRGSTHMHRATSPKADPMAAMADGAATSSCAATATTGRYYT